MNTSSSSANINFLEMKEYQDSLSNLNEDYQESLSETLSQKDRFIKNTLLDITSQDYLLSPDGTKLYHVGNLIQDLDFVNDPMLQEVCEVSPWTLEDHKHLRSILFSPQIKKIPEQFAKGCKNLKEVSIPEKTKVDEKAFISCNQRLKINNILKKDFFQQRKGK